MPTFPSFRHRRPFACLVVALSGGFAAVAGLAAPGGSVHAAPLSEEWELDFRPGELRHFVDPVDGKAYWYFTYQVLNRTGAERMWAPKFEFYGDRGQLLDSGRGVPTRVTKTLLEKAGTKFTQDQYQILGPILVGEENAKDGLVVFPEPETFPDPNLTEVILYVHGITNASRRDPDPVTGQIRVQRRVLELRFLVPGDPALTPPRAAEPGGIDEEIRKSPDGRPLPPVPANPKRQTDGRSWQWR